VIDSGCSSLMILMDPDKLAERFVAKPNSGLGLDDCDVGSTRSVLGARKLERACFRVNPKAFNTIRILACHKNKLSTRIECEVPSVRVSRKRAPT